MESTQYGEDYTHDLYLEMIVILLTSVFIPFFFDKRNINELSLHLIEL